MDVEFAHAEGYWEQRGARLERADPTSEKGRGDTSYLADRSTPGVAANGTHGPSPEQYDNEQTAGTAPPHDPLSAADGPAGVVRQQGNGIAPSDHGRETTRIAADVAGQKQPSGNGIPSVKI
ncbi:hypothetical protein BGY98DRAFT_995400 [Russula aff. rugulosa BPL654]|nr:hypothetical protein BGY98DRAFT_995400 [Russula aff. rugulosa BPL654]